ncbi:TetR family transcriptional regulator [Eggerthellaceae bacterium zg-887]|uniref:TetR/AcrR family transcriptional regulator n=1 Tax=Xiamenia xianingshaonis TaxID=2682776 RepID=UPI00140CE8A3|nr:TetR/AcrR family transcriptional regulator [Xiamenia xianingshaonis]NHM16614.1 TetR family transcriptional regulator [Xiamenia xianingshaonis]
MARPAYRGDTPTAKERLREAFWGLLSHEEYGRITIKALAAQAGVNPNTFYYHYANMEDLARDALDAEKLHEIPEAIRNSARPGSASLESALSLAAVDNRWRRIRLFVASDSPVLRRLFYETFEGLWLSLLGVDKDDLTDEDALDLVFMLNGAMGVIALQGDDYDIGYVRSLPERPLGRGLIETVERLAERYRV